MPATKGKTVVIAIELAHQELLASSVFFHSSMSFSFCIFFNLQSLRLLHVINLDNWIAVQCQSEKGREPNNDVGGGHISFMN